MEVDDRVITIKVSEDACRYLEENLSNKTDGESTSDLLERFSVIAFMEFYHWVAGTKRYRSITEQYIDWVEQMYTQILPQDEAPSGNRIYNSLNIPYGQATYIARVLSAKTLVHWRDIAKKELRDKLLERKTVAEQYLKEGTLDQLIQIQLSKIACIELERICSERHRKDDQFLLPQIGASSGDYKFIHVPACTIVDLTSDKKR